MEILFEFVSWLFSCPRKLLSRSILRKSPQSGPREISIRDADAIRDIHGLRTECRKGPFYEWNYPSRSLHMTRNKAFHAKRRKLWDKGFSLEGRVRALVAA